MAGSSSTEKRSLRSNYGSAQKLNKIIFDFDTSVTINYHEKLLITTTTEAVPARLASDGSVPKNKNAGALADLPPVPLVAKTLNGGGSSSSNSTSNSKAPIKVGSNAFELFTYRDFQTGRRRAADPLTYKPFEAYHTFLERAERRTQTSERERHANELERLTTLLDDLEGPDWRRKLLEVTAIVNPNDRLELELKRERTLDELRVYIAKYQATRSAERRLKRLKQQRERRGGKPGHDEDPGVDDFGPALDSDSDEDAYVYEYVYDLPNKLANDDRNKDEKLAFGVNLPEMKRVDFKLPEEWKRKNRR
ncbi:hypothetical protein D0Z00_002019 [Geotrichum galactomycetum]|uniref:Uncharacterized protein n=1 Tax=Geotrichum galactomycetum TaxID=27317 RepID=A0ACB6V5E9_9ASCO|nr:hypothetical protein D0Z00_002019 [Geotrichum candidum]